MRTVCRAGHDQNAANGAVNWSKTHQVHVVMLALKRKLTGSVMVETKNKERWVINIERMVVAKNIKNAEPVLL